LNNDLIWNRKLDGGFPESKQLKQLIRNKIAPEKELGHSDVQDNDLNAAQTSMIKNDCVECEDNSEDSKKNSHKKNENSSGFEGGDLPNVKILYCPENEWLFRSAWMAQEILSMFPDQIYSVTLKPSNTNSSGIFKISFGTEEIWNHEENDMFLNAEELKYLISQKLNQGDSSNLPSDSVEEESDDIDDESAAEMRKYYGVL